MEVYYYNGDKAAYSTSVEDYHWYITGTSGRNRVIWYLAVAEFTDNE